MNVDVVGCYAYVVEKLFPHIVSFPFYSPASFGDYVQAILLVQKMKDLRLDGHKRIDE